MKTAWGAAAVVVFITGVFFVLTLSEKREAWRPGMRCMDWHYRTIVEAQ